MPDRFKKINEDIFRGGEPSVEDLRILANVFDIKTIVSLSGSIGHKIDPVVKQLEMEHIIIPISGLNSIDFLKYLKTNIVNIINTKKPIYIHCKHGSDRTGLAIAIYRIEHDGWTPQQALDEAKSFGFGDKLDPETEKLYLQFFSNKDNNSAFDDADIAQVMRDNYDGGHNPPAFTMQQSFAPYNPIRDDYDQGRKKRQKTLRNMLMDIMMPDDNGEEKTDIPLTGQHDNGTGMIGFGPMEPQVGLGFL